MLLNRQENEPNEICNPLAYESMADSVINPMDQYVSERIDSTFILNPLECFKCCSHGDILAPSEEEYSSISTVEENKSVMLM